MELKALLWHVHSFNTVSVDIVVECRVLSTVVRFLSLGCISHHFIIFSFSWTTKNASEIVEYSVKSTKNASEAKDRKYKKAT